MWTPNNSTNSSFFAMYWIAWRNINFKLSNNESTECSIGTITNTIAKPFLYSYIREKLPDFNDSDSTYLHTNETTASATFFVHSSKQYFWFIILNDQSIQNSIWISGFQLEVIILYRNVTRGSFSFIVCDYSSSANNIPAFIYILVL